MNDIKNKIIVKMVLVFLVLTFPIFAQEKKEQERLAQKELEKKAVNTDRYIISRLNGPVKLDGLSEEPAWEGIEPLSVVMHSPNFLDEPTERTEILVAYDDDFLYVAGRLYDSEPSKIQCTSKKRDDLKPNNDWFGIVIDTFNDKENALVFFTTPSGLRLDMSVFNDAQGELPINTDWNTYWDVKAERNKKGWFVEMRIPLSSLQFQDKDGSCIMGLISWRWIARKNESVVFPAIPPNWGGFSLFKPSQAQEVVFQGIHKKRPLYVAPYVLGGFGHSYELNDAETAYDRTDDPAHEAGLDIKYGLANNLTLDVTVNTDFAQVEADDEQVNLTRFSLFFPEKRLFFQERSSTFDFNLGGPNSLFYSRRIGIYEGQSVRIYGGARLVGRVGPWDLGFLNMQTAAVEDLPSENFGVLRVRRQVLNPYSYLGGIITSRIGVDNTYNIAYGLDGIFRLFGNDYLSFKWAQTFENGQENNLDSLNQARIGVNWERRYLKGLGYDFSFSRVGSTFNPGMGFQMRENYTRFGDRLLYGWSPGEKSSLLRHHVFLDGFLLLENTSGSMESAQIGPGWEFETKSGAFGNFAFKMYWEDVPEEFELSDDAEVPVGKYSFYGLNATYITPMTRLFFTQNTLEVGAFYDGWRLSLSVSPWWSISSSLELSGMYQFNRVVFPDRDQQFTAHIARLRLLAMLSIKFSATAFIQYNSASNTVITNIRIRYNPREGNDFYFVYNEGINTNRYGQIPIPPSTSNRAVMIKYSYTFNF
jgi:hypothetical protein